MGVWEFRVVEFRVELSGLGCLGADRGRVGVRSTGVGMGKSTQGKGVRWWSELGGFGGSAGGRD